MEPPCPSPTSRDTVRKLLSQVLRSDADLMAFCSDYFADISRRFSDTMNRVQKVTLLLDLADTAEILEKLKNAYPDAVQRRLEEIGPGVNNRIVRHVGQRQGRIEQLFQMKESLTSLGQSCLNVDQEIQSIKRELRRGPLLNPGEFLCGRYRLIHVIGSGGFATLWLAYDRQKQRRVAVKVLHPQCGAQPGCLERFQRGARKLQALHHPHIVSVLSEVEEHEGFHYVVMEYVPRGDLRQAVKDGTLPAGRLLMIHIEIAEALAHLHAQGLVHRDVKPQNILLDEHWCGRLCDFDLVFAADTTGGTRTGPLGTFLYAAPEALEDASRIDERADIYSLAMTILFTLHGTDLPTRVIQNSIAFLNEQISCSDAIKAVLRRALAWDRSERHGSMIEFVAALKQALITPDKPMPQPLHPILATDETLAVEFSGSPPVPMSEYRRALGALRQDPAGSWANLLGLSLLILTIAVDLLVKYLSRPAPADLPALPLPGPWPPPPTQPLVLPLNMPGKKLEMHKTEVTVSQYLACVKAGRCTSADKVYWRGIPEAEAALYSEFCNADKPGREDHPINCIDWHQASAYCQWQEMRLPSSEEYEYAATGGKSQLYPWGDDPPNAQLLNACDDSCVALANRLKKRWSRLGVSKVLLVDQDGQLSERLFFGSDSYATTAPVGSYPSGQSPLGFLDLAGNVREWTTDSQRLEVNGEMRTCYILKGGSWSDVAAADVAATARTSLSPADVRADLHGFRCVRPIVSGSAAAGTSAGAPNGGPIGVPAGR